MQMKERFMKLGGLENMAFLNKLDEKLTMLGQGAIQRTKEVTDSAKLSSAIKTLEANKKEVLSELGSLYYEQYKKYGGNIEQEVETVMKQIEDIEQQILEQKSQIQKVKGVIYCSNCNAEIPVGSVFCNVCGNKVELEKKGRTCRNCGEILEEGQLFCTNCGVKVEKTEMEGEPEKEEIKECHHLVCPNCGGKVEEGQSFCTVCGTRLE